MQIYHNPRCSKSRQSLKILTDAGYEPEIIEYLKTPPTEATLRAVLKKLNYHPTQLFRKKESLYKELQLAQKQLNEEQLIAVLSKHPKLIERPIVVSGDKAVLGRPPENVKALFAQ